MIMVRTNEIEIHVLLYFIMVLINVFVSVRGITSTIAIAIGLRGVIYSVVYKDDKNKSVVHL